MALTDIDKLKKYNDLIIEINELNKQFDEFDSYELVNLTLSPDTVININMENMTGKNAESKRFTLSQIDIHIEKARKNLDYRKKKFGKTDKDGRAETS